MSVEPVETNFCIVMDMDMNDDSQVSMLREALRGLADDDGCVSEEALQNVAGFESVAATLEEQLGCGPWHVARLEELFFGTSSKEEDEEDRNSRKADVSPVQLGRFASPPRRHLPRRHTVNFAEEVHHMVDGEDADDEWFRVIGALEEALREDEEQDAAQLMQLLRRTFQMMQSWHHQRQKLQEQFDRAAEQAKLQSDRADTAETARLAAEAAEAATVAQLEEQEKRLVQGRETIKSQKQDLEEARHRIELQEVELREHQQRLKLTEDKLRRRLETYEEQQQSRATTPRVPDGQDSLAKKLIAAEAELEALREELLSSEEAAALEHKRASELEAALEQSHREFAEWKEQQALQSSKRRAKQGGPSSRSRSFVELASTPLSEDLQTMASGDAAAGPKVPKQNASPVVPKLAIFDRKARLQAQLSRPSPSNLQPRRPEGAAANAPPGPNRPSRSSMPADMASLSRLLGAGLLGPSGAIKATP